MLGCGAETGLFIRCASIRVHSKLCGADRNMTRKQEDLIDEVRRDWCDE